MKFQPYTFEKLNLLLEGLTPNPDYSPIALTIGEPQFETPSFIQEQLALSASKLNKYPKSSGEENLKASQIAFNKTRFGIALEASQIIPTFGTREVLFNFPQFWLHDKPNPKIAYTNPFYQIYEGAAIASRASVLHINLLQSNNFKPNISEEEIDGCDLVILNFPNNPTASTLSVEELGWWVKMALKYDFVLINDECYSELYTTTPPPSILNASIAVGNTAFKNVLAINSISKRSSAPGLRSGFIAGDATILKEYMQYRTYVGVAIPLPLQDAAAVAWANEAHVMGAREKYNTNFKLAEEILGIKASDATFYIYLEVGDELAFAKRAFVEKNLRVLPASFMGREDQGKGFIRLALVHDASTTKEALKRLKELL